MIKPKSQNKKVVFSKKVLGAILDSAAYAPRWSSFLIKPDAMCKWAVSQCVMRWCNKTVILNVWPVSYDVPTFSMSTNHWSNPVLKLKISKHCNNLWTMIWVHHRCGETPRLVHCSPVHMKPDLRSDGVHNIRRAAADLIASPLSAAEEVRVVVKKWESFWGKSATLRFFDSWGEFSRLFRSCTWRRKWVRLQEMTVRLRRVTFSDRNQTTSTVQPLQRLSSAQRH